jgi:hypothetical protein
MGFPCRAVDLALAAQIVANMGMVIDREAIDRCGCCRVTFRRKNKLRHVRSRSHRRAFIRAWRGG